jgi:hypothetical protein
MVLRFEAEEVTQGAEGMEDGDKRALLGGLVGSLDAVLPFLAAALEASFGRAAGAAAAGDADAAAAQGAVVSAALGEPPACAPRSQPSVVHSACGPRTSGCGLCFTLPCAPPRQPSKEFANQGSLQVLQKVRRCNARRAAGCCGCACLLDHRVFAWVGAFCKPGGQCGRLRHPGGSRAAHGDGVHAVGP